VSFRSATFRKLENSLTISPAKNCCVFLSRNPRITPFTLSQFYDLRTAYGIELCYKHGQVCRIHISVEGLLRQLNYKIEIAPWHGLAPRIGAEQAQPTNAQPSAGRLILLNQLEDIVST
jgi:hypothetical protein